MLRRMGIIAVALLWGLSASAADDAGYVLLEKTTTQFQQMGKEPLDEQKLQTALNEMMASAKRAKAEGRIDEAFFERYARLVRVLRVVTIQDPEGILVPVFQKEVSSFVQSALGPQASGSAQPGIPEIARAFTKELEALKRLLDQKK